jgi:hypothetical protein
MTARANRIRPSTYWRAFATCVLALIPLALLSALPLGATERSKTVLAIYDQERLLPANMVVDSVLRDSLGLETDNPPTYLSEFLDVSRFGSSDYDKLLSDFFRSKYAGQKIMVKADSYDCLQCHANIGHAYEQSSPKAGGWYSAEQAAAGRQLFEKSCAGCHGAKLEGISGPALTGTTWLQRFGGAKLLTVWGEIKGPMAEYAGASFTTQQSLDILAYLLQQNGLAAGNQPLADTQELSDTLPEK